MSSTLSSTARGWTDHRSDIPLWWDYGAEHFKISISASENILNLYEKFIRIEYKCRIHDEERKVGYLAG